MTKKTGSAKARKQVSNMTKMVLKTVVDLPLADASDLLGIGIDDIRNMRQGNNVSSLIFCKLVAKGRYNPTALVDCRLRKMPKGTDTRACSMALVNERVRKLAYSMEGKKLAKATGLSVTGAYGLRYSKGNATLTTLLGLLELTTPRQLFLGKTK